MGGKMGQISIVSGDQSWQSNPISFRRAKILAKKMGKCHEKLYIRKCYSVYGLRGIVTRGKIVQVREKADGTHRFFEGKPRKQG